MVNRDKKFLINEGRAITNGNFAYGGFPRILNEEEQPATTAFRDSVTDPNPNVATQTNQQEGDSVEDLHAAWDKASKASFNFNADMNILDKKAKMEAIRAARQMPKGRARNKSEFDARTVTHPHSEETLAERERLKQEVIGARTRYEAHPGYAAHDKKLEELRRYLTHHGQLFGYENPDS
jgi:hypothetical protein